MSTVLIVGSGGREHALAWALARSKQVAHVYVAPGNAGTIWPANPAARGFQPHAAASNVPIGVDDFPALIDFARDKQIALTVVGPEAPLSAGIVDAFQAADLPVFGPTQAAAQLESSKAFAKAFMNQHNIPTAACATFQDYNEAVQYLHESGLEAVVIKADGLAAGKGVIVCDTADEARDALHRIMVTREFGDAGNTVIVEERLRGKEVSLLALCDGRTVLPMVPARDHKPVFDGDQGPNTGGMGAYTHPADVDQALLEMIERDVLQPVVAGMAAQGIPYRGVLYAGLMLTEKGPQVLEFNCRFGDPEIQAIIPLISSDLLTCMHACVEERLDTVSLSWYDGVGATVVLASGGYPGSYPKGIQIDGLDVLAQRDDCIVFHAGTARHDNDFVTAGGRVLAVSAVGANLATALQHVYDGVDQIHFEGMHYRKDIGRSSV